MRGADANLRDILSGVIYIAFGLFFAVGAWVTLPIGNTFFMGPGYFPLAVGTLLVCLGAAIALRGVRTRREEIGAVPWRALVLVVGAAVAFGVTVRGLGLVPALAIAIFASSFASRRMTFPVALALTLGLTCFCVAVFVYGLNLQLRLFGPLLGI